MTSYISCMRLYAYLRKQLIQTPVVTPTRSGLTLMHFKIFRHALCKLRNCWNKLSASLIGQELDIIEKFYK
ncbi:hypothetical protein SOVF_204630 [Spinacia oleracea]|nr:hypothetical protein SOVF_204630 [Spinacia oleracea]